MTEFEPRVDICVAEIARAVEEEAHEYGEDPLMLDLVLYTNDQRWWIETGMDYPYNWPRGRGAVAWEWPTDPQTSAERHEKLNAEFRRLLAYFHHRRFPTWESIDAELGTLVTEIESLRSQVASLPVSEARMDLLAERLADVRDRLEAGQHAVTVARERDYDRAAMVQGFNRYED
jgi:hypothetical protein